ncbi:hypothetical protein ONS95_011103 [Cadophora gregata]|uniref:uncharacterized protein n=1 Tax=Cadophora gregata TaxID=51156 RepID=UPI0026DD13E0|nr:uncharacterized protein ONS95_011103 [Cadophora gregata]KAK0119666.1 hypothetical protein ONS95_011103 [Cadophora gregata]
MASYSANANARALASANSLKQRLLQDIAELQAKPYPNIALHVQEDDLEHACLILTVEEYGNMHLTIDFPTSFPLAPPRIRMDSDVHHPNIFGSYICASILNTEEGYTPAYTLKGIAIQLLSFFSSDKIEQSGGGYSVDIKKYRSTQGYIRSSHMCNKCRFGLSDKGAGRALSIGSASSSTTSGPSTPPPPVAAFIGEDVEMLDIHWPSPQKSASIGRRRRSKDKKTPEKAPTSAAQTELVATKGFKGIQHMKLPDEILLLFCDNLEYEDLMIFAEAWDEIGTIMTKYDIIRTRELQCFCFKSNYMTSRLGVGVSIEKRGRIGSFESEFDLLSMEGFTDHRIRRSVQGVKFQHWLGLPISNGHWRKVKDGVATALSTLGMEAGLVSGDVSQVIYAFMNDIVVKLNKQTEQATIRAPYYPYEETPKSTLTHASEKAIESYFHLFHLLLCLATENPSIVRAANAKLNAFARGENSKTDCPNLGHLLVAALISDVEMTEKMIKSIVRETMTRNVVWMLDTKGTGMAELSYLEPSLISDYRLQKSFEASKTSYRLLMFLNLFRRVAVGNPRKPLAVLRDEAFERHGAPPLGSAKGLADSIKRIHQVSSFPHFLTHMGIEKVSKEWFNTFLKDCIKDSISKGYSCMPISQGQALTLRQLREPDVEVTAGVVPQQVNMFAHSFFPGHGNSGFGGSRGRGGRDGYRGRSGNGGNNGHDGYGGRGGRGGLGTYRGRGR